MSYGACEFMDDVIRQVIDSGLATRGDFSGDDASEQAKIVMRAITRGAIYDDDGTYRKKVQNAIWHLRRARELLKDADAPKATARVRLALTSAEGAERNASRRDWLVTRG